MANKPRVKAPKQRTSERRAEDEAKKRRLYMLGGAGLAALLAIIGVVALLGLAGGSKASPSEVRALLEAAGCTMQVKEAVAATHVDDPEAKNPDWNTDPPTSGPHYGQTLAYGSYTEPIDLPRVLHNLEHGAIYILHGNKVPDSTIAQLHAFYADHQNGTVLAPYAKLGKQIALGAWVVPGLPEASSDGGSGILAKCEKFDEEAYASFFDAFQFSGPESSLFRPSDLAPGKF